tara:strand:- start:33 stop:623 length:591 start_codon:yes stop_codon:yes gene_type:complete
MIVEVSATELRTEHSEHSEHSEHPLDMLKFAIGFDAITGALKRINPIGRGGIAQKQRWPKRFNPYLGMTIPGLPNLFMKHGPESSCVVFNMSLGAELEADWIRDCIVHLRGYNFGAIEPASGVDVAWARDVEEAASETLFPKTESWHTGANMEGKHRQIAVHMGGPACFEKLTQIPQAGCRVLVMDPTVKGLDSAV